MKEINEYIAMNPWVIFMFFSFLVGYCAGGMASRALKKVEKLRLELYKKGLVEFNDY